MLKNRRQYQSGFTWTDSSAIDYANWATNEPDDLPLLNSNCVCIVASNKFSSPKWFDGSCDKSFKALCKKSALY